MKIPDSIRIAGVEYEVVYTDDLANGAQLAYGHIDYEKCRIELNTKFDCDHQHLSVTFLHEVLHGIVHAFGMELEDEEAIVEMLGKGIYQVLQDNGKRLFDIKTDTDK